MVMGIGRGMAEEEKAWPSDKVASHKITKADRIILVVLANVERQGGKHEASTSGPEAESKETEERCAKIDRAKSLPEELAGAG